MFVNQAPILNNLIEYKSKIGLIILCFLLSIPASYCQDLLFSNLQKKDGLPSNSVQAVEKDNLGFIWIATTDGLCRYQGSSLVKVYRKTEGTDSSNSLQSNNIRSLHADSQGNLWIGTRFGGLSRLNPLKNEWRTFRHNAQDETSIDNDEVLSILEDSDKNVWVGTEKGLNLFDPISSTFKRIKLYDDGNKDSGSRPVLSIMEDNKGWIWIGTWSGGIHLLLKDEQNNYSTKQTKHIQTTQDKAANNVWKLFQDNEGRYWLGTHGGGLLIMQLPNVANNKIDQQEWRPNFLEFKQNSALAPNLNSNTIQTIIQDDRDHIWIGCAYGLHMIASMHLPPLDAKEPFLHFQLFLHDSKNEKSVISNGIVDMTEDEQGMIWVATDDGLSQYNWFSNQFKNHDYPESQLDLPLSLNFTIDESENIWVAFGLNGISKYKIENGTLTKLDPKIKHLIAGTEVMTLYSPEVNRLFVGTEKGISVVDLKNLRSEQYLIPKSISSTIQRIEISSILEDDNKDIWFASKAGLFKINTKTKAFSHFEPKSNDPNSISDLAINQIIHDSKGSIWITTYRGLNKIENPNSDSIVFDKFFYDDKNLNAGPINNRIICVKEYGGYMYIGTTSGLCRYNYKTKLFQPLDSEGHKYSIRSIEAGANKNIWVSTTEGVFEFDTEQLKYRVFDKGDGLTNIGYLINSSHTSQDGQMYFAYDRGFTTFSPYDIPVNTIPPPVYITEIEKMTPDGVVVIEGINQKEIELEHDDYRLSINYAALNYNRGDKNKYAYKLVGFEDKWNELAPGSPIVFTSLKPNSYELKLKASNNDGIWNETGTSLKIIQHAPFWATWWFRLLAILCAIGLMFFLFKWYTKNIRTYNVELKTYNNKLNQEIAQRIEIEKQIQGFNVELMRSNKELEQFAYVSSHDLKEPLRTIGNFSSLLEKKYSTKLDEEGIEYISFIKQGVHRMSNVIESLLTYSIVGKKDSRYELVKLNNILQNNIKDLSHLIQNKNAEIRIEPLPNIIAHKDQLAMVFFNLISNALKFNDNKTPVIKVSADTEGPDFWKFSISDNGIGIDEKYQKTVFDIFKRLHNQQDYEGTGIGLSVCQKIVTRHEGEIWFESIPKKGTTFFFTIKKDLAMEEMT